MSFDLKRLYELLPALYRIRDAELGQKTSVSDEERVFDVSSNDPDRKINRPLEALFSIIAGEIAVIEENLEQLYNDQFIETCAEWVVPYIGNLVGTRNLIEIPAANFSRRSDVANTIKYRRRKGTASVIEQLARDITGWDANVVEYFELLATTQYLNHLRPHNLAVTRLNKRELLEYIDTPFDQTARTVDVRHIARKRGKYNIPNVGVFLWRIKNYSLTQSPAYKVDERRYTFDALGKIAQLYHSPIPEETITQLAEPVNVPIPIGRSAMTKELETYYGVGKSLLIYIDGKPLTPENIHSLLRFPGVSSSFALQDVISICRLSNVFDDKGALAGWANMPQNKIAIDPVLGRIAFPPNVLLKKDSKVKVTYHYGFSTEMGGGEYDRETTFEAEFENLIEVTAGNGSIQEALDQLKETGGVVEIKDNEYYFETLIIRAAEGKTIELRAADGYRPVLVLDDYIKIETEKNARVVLNGLLIRGGGVYIGSSSQLKLLRIVHCTLVPGAGRKIETMPAAPALPRIKVKALNTQVEIEKTITGGLRITDGAKVSINDSIVDGSEESGVAYTGLSDSDPGGVLLVKNSTVIGKVHTRMMELASNTIFFAENEPSSSWPAPVMAQRLQQGCVRFSYFPPESRLPRPYRCQPAAKAGAVHIRSVFTSLAYGDPGYCQLSGHCPLEITQGADDEAEMGAFHHLYQPQRVANLRTRLNEYLRFGLEAGIFYAS